VGAKSGHHSACINLSEFIRDDQIRLLLSNLKWPINCPAENFVCCDKFFWLKSISHTNLDKSDSCASGSLRWLCCASSTYAPAPAQVVLQADATLVIWS
jgi:hypothetical protein